MPPSVPRLLGIGTALPEHSSAQAAAAAFMQRILEREPDAERRQRALTVLDRVAETSGVARRYSVVPDFTADDPDRFELFPPNVDLEPFPSTAHRMRLFEQKSVPLATCAARRALDRAGVSPTTVTHLIVCTCTGFFAPGPDIHLVRALGLPEDVERLQLGFMGCYAGASGLRLGAQLAAADPANVVLQVCVELCTLHYQKDTEPEHIVANLLFGDAAAAAVYASRPEGPALARVGPRRVETAPDSLDQMAWRIGDTGFDMRLSVRVPASIRRAAPRFLARLLAAGGHDREAVTGWAIHPGGRAILEATTDALDLPADAVEASFNVLACPGNVSSASVFFVLDRLLSSASGPATNGTSANGLIVALAFGPGLTLEGSLLEPE